MSDLAVYPTSIIPDLPIEITEINKTYITELETGREFRRTNWLRPKRAVKLKYNNIGFSELFELYNFYKSMKGSLYDFIYIHFTKVDWEDEYIGRVIEDENYLSAELPVKFDSVEKFYLKKNGEMYSDFKITENPSGRDLINVYNLQKGDLITCDFIGKPALKMRFKEDELDVSQFAAMIFVLGIELVEVI